MKLIDEHTGISLREFRSEDKARLIELANNANIANNLRDGFPHPYTLEAAEQFIKDSQSSNPTTRFCIEKDGVYVGNIGLHPDTDIYRMNAEIGYFVGEPYWGKGIASQAVKLMVTYGFDHLNVHRIGGGVFSYNVASAKVLENAGFEYEGKLKQAVFKNGVFYDELRYGIVSNLI
ncbi:MAG: GNAT family N-acetyltransferase [Crocinitomicaceae bacterium]